MFQHELLFIWRVNSFFQNIMRRLLLNSYRSFEGNTSVFRVGSPTVLGLLEASCTFLRNVGNCLPVDIA